MLSLQISNLTSQFKLFQLKKEKEISEKKRSLHPHPPPNEKNKRKHKRVHEKLIMCTIKIIRADLFSSMPFCFLHVGVMNKGGVP